MEHWLWRNGLAPDYAPTCADISALKLTGVVEQMVNGN